MVVTPVRALNSIKRDGIVSVTNNPVEFWIFRNGNVDSILGIRRTSLVEDSSQMFYKNSTSLPLTVLSSTIQIIPATTVASIRPMRYGLGEGAS